jgi:hypothetical protein
VIGVAATDGSRRQIFLANNFYQFINKASTLMWTLVTKSNLLRKAKRENAKAHLSFNQCRLINFIFPFIFLSPKQNFY